MLIISVRNKIWWAVMAAIAVGTGAMYALLQGLPEAQIRSSLLWFSILVFVLYFVQRLFMFRDPLFLAVFGSNWKDLLVQLLPFHLCYASLIVAIVGLAWNQPYILSFCFYVGACGALLAVLSPDGYYLDKSLLHPPILLFYLLHGMLVALYCNISFLRLFPLSWKYGTVSVLVLIVLITVMHLINLAGRALGLSSVNYIYTLDPSGSSLLEMLWRVIPRPYLYLTIPISLLAWAWAMLITGSYKVLVWFGLLRGW